MTHSLMLLEEVLSGIHENIGFEDYSKEDAIFEIENLIELLENHKAEIQRLYK